MDVLTAIDSRVSATKLAAPGPTREHLERILLAGVRAPDHGRLRPWRFVVLEGAARETLADAMAASLRVRLPDATPDQLEAERDKALRSPTIVVTAATITRSKIPEIEQVVAVGAAIQNMFLAARALGYGAMWKTGLAAYDPQVKTTLGLSPEDHIVGLLHLGTTVTESTPAPATLEQCVRWL